MEQTQPQGHLRIQQVRTADGADSIRGSVACPACRTTIAVSVPPLLTQTSQLSAEARLEPTLNELCSRRVTCVRPDVSIESLAALLDEHGTCAMPVVNDEGRPVGIVATAELARLILNGDAMQEGEPPRVALGRGVSYNLGPAYHVERWPRATVDEIMTPFLFSLPAHTSVSRAAALMAYEGIDHLMVVDEDGSVAGVVSALDLLRSYATRAGFVVPLTRDHSAGRSSEDGKNQPMPSAFDRPKMVLVVDDDMDSRDAILETLRTAGYTAHCATNGKEAMDQLETGVRPSVILLDLMMPIMDGWQFLAERARKPRLSSIPVVVLSAYGNPARSDSDMTIADYLQKPFGLDRLLTTVDRHCRPS